MEENPETELQPISDQMDLDPPQQEGESISGMVNQEFSAQLQEMGFIKDVCEKALLLTSNESIESAFAWIEEHQNDPDFNEPLVLVGSNQGQKMSREEAQAKARELQQQLREKRALKEKELELQQEKERLRSGRELQQARKQFEELEAKRVAEERKKEKQQYQSELKKMQELLKKEKAERFGKKVEESEVAQGQMSQQEKLAHYVKTIKTLYPNYRSPGVAANAFKLIQAYLRNIVQNPLDDKFQRIRMQNQAFQIRLAQVTGGLHFLKNCNFQEDGEFLVCTNVDVALLEYALKMLENAIREVGG